MVAPCSSFTSLKPHSYFSKEGLLFGAHSCLNLSGDRATKIIKTVKSPSLDTHYHLVEIEKESHHYIKTSLRVAFYATILLPAIAMLTSYSLSTAKTQKMYYKTTKDSTWFITITPKWINIISLLLVGAKPPQSTHNLILPVIYSPLLKACMSNNTKEFAALLKLAGNNIIYTIPTPFRGKILGGIRQQILQIDPRYFDDLSYQYFPKFQRAAPQATHTTLPNQPSTHTTLLAQIFGDEIPNPLTKATLTQRYRRLVLANHPDRIQDPTEKQNANNRTVKITSAWTALQDTNWYTRLPEK